MQVFCKDTLFGRYFKWFFEEGKFLVGRYRPYLVVDAIIFLYIPTLALLLIMFHVVFAYVLQVARWTWSKECLAEVSSLLV